MKYTADSFDCKYLSSRAIIGLLDITTTDFMALLWDENILDKDKYGLLADRYRHRSLTTGYTKHVIDRIWTNRGIGLIVSLYDRDYLSGLEVAQ